MYWILNAGSVDIAPVFEPRDMNGQVGNFFRSYLTDGVVFNGLYQFDDSGYIESITMSPGGADENVTHHLCGCNVERSSVTFPLESIAELTPVAAVAGRR